MTALPPLLPVAEIQKRLEVIFPEGTPERTYCIREIAARTVYTMLYIGAVEGGGVNLAPKHVYRMTAEQAAKTDDQDRLAYLEASSSRKYVPPGERWYQDNTREPIRDETLREGLVNLGAVVIDASIPTTSGTGRYALQKEFAELFRPHLSGKELEDCIAQWQASHLSASALARTKLMRRGIAAPKAGVPIRFPNGEIRHLSTGPSSVISKAVIETFAPRFLEAPGVLFLSESGEKVVARDDELARDIGLKIETKKHLPDIILVDLGPKDPVLVFVEVVATAGHINERRQAALRKLATDAGFTAKQVGFVTAYEDRNSPALKRTVATLAWGSFTWFMSEPDHILVLRDNRQPQRGLLAMLL